MGRLGRKRAAADFSWGSIAAQTAGLYAELAGNPASGQAAGAPGG
jgi:hypothetical protein